MAGNDGGTPPILGQKHYAQPSAFTPENLLREARRQKRIADSGIPKICVLDPDKGMHLTNFHGVFAPNSRLRALVVKAPPEEDCSHPQRLSSRAPGEPTHKPTPPRRPKVDWATLQRKTFGDDVWACPCGGRPECLRW